MMLRPVGKYSEISVSRTPYRQTLVTISFKIDQSIFPPLFDWFNSNGDSEISSEEFINGTKKMFDYQGFPNDYWAYYYQAVCQKFKQKYWHLIDVDNSDKFH